MYPLLPLLLLLPNPPVASKVQTGQYISSTNSSGWDFLARFCFRAGDSHNVSSEERRLAWEFEFSAAQCCPTLGVYHDSPRQWQSVYRSDMSCREKEDGARAKIPLTAGQECTLDTESQTYKYVQ